tara:strand:- start:4922 stop:5215 length:294 start_codon:yes stop_codon:yes gene_type:complete
MKDLNHTTWHQFISDSTKFSVDDQHCLLDLVLTAKEQQAITTRLKIFTELLHGQKSQRELASQLSVSIATITRCSNYLSHMSTSEYQRIKSLLHHSN